MKRLILGAGLTAIATGAWAQTCTVNDPSGTPLNVRASPYGAILGALQNGALVKVQKETSDRRGDAWAYIVPVQAGKTGWAFRKYLSCGNQRLDR